MTELPQGIVTFLFTDIEGSTRLWEQDPDVMSRALTQHNAILAAAISRHGGYHFKTIGDAFQAAFHDAPSALRAAVEGQRDLAAARWPFETGSLRVRMALHLGEAVPSGGDYTAACLNRLARLLATGFGGQILLTDAVRRLVEGRLPEGVTLLDLGRHRLRDLLEPERVAQAVVAGLPDRFPPLKSLERHPTNLPLQPSPLVGREAELALLRDALADAGLSGRGRLLTLTGAGGTGKTRLALQAAADALSAFADGAFVVDLAPLTDPALVLPTIAQTLGVRETAGRTLRESLLAYLGDKQLLLVLDNVEHLLPAAPVVADLLAGCPRLVVLATSREALRLRGEREIAVPPLPLPDPAHLPPLEELAGIAAVELFLQRAREARSDFALTEANARTIAEICVRLDGLPLAIELAAARVKILNPAAIRDRLDRRLTLLTGGARDLPARQQTLRATIGWSHDLLSPDERALFRRLAVFAGGCTLEAVEAVCHQGSGAHDSVPASRPLPPDPAALDGLASLVDKSLVRRTEASDGEARFVMLETLREFAWERLEAAGESEALQRAHAGWVRHLVEEAAPWLTGPDPERWLDRLETEHDNLRTALAWAEETTAAEFFVQVAAALAPFWRVRSHLSEGRRWLESALAADQAGVAPLRLDALVGAGRLANAQGDYGQATIWFEEALARARACGDRGLIAPILNNLGGIAVARGELARAETLYTDSLQQSQALGDQAQYAITLGNLGALAHYRGDLQTATERYEASLALCRKLRDKEGMATMLLNLLLIAAPSPAVRERAEALGEECLRLLRQLGDRQGMALALTGLGLAAETGGDLARAAALHEEGLALFRAIDDRGGVARALMNLGLTAGDRGDLERAITLCRESLVLAAELGERDTIAYALEAVGHVALLNGQPERAARLLGAAEALRDQLGVPLPAESVRRHERAVSSLRTGLSEASLAVHWAEGRTRSTEQAIAEAVGNA